MCSGPASTLTTARPPYRRQPIESNWFDPADLSRHCWPTALFPHHQRCTAPAAMQGRCPLAPPTAFGPHTKPTAPANGARARAWLPGWWWHGSAHQAPQRGLNPRKLDGRNGFLQVGEAAEQLGDVVGGEKAPVALQKGRGIPIGIIEEFLEGVIPPGHGLATIGLKGRPSYPLGRSQLARTCVSGLKPSQLINRSMGPAASRRSEAALANC